MIDAPFLHLFLDFSTAEKYFYSFYVAWLELHHKEGQFEIKLCMFKMLITYHVAFNCCVLSA